VNEQKYDSSSLRVKNLSCRGEGGVEWPGGPLWSPAVSSSLRVKNLSCRGEGCVEWMGGPLWSPAVPLNEVEPKILAMDRIEKYTIVIAGI